MSTSALPYPICASLANALTLLAPTNAIVTPVNVEIHQQERAKILTNVPQFRTSVAMGDARTLTAVISVLVTLAFSRLRIEQNAFPPGRALVTVTCRAATVETRCLTALH